MSEPLNQGRKKSLPRGVRFLEAGNQGRRHRRGNPWKHLLSRVGNSSKEQTNPNNNGQQKRPGHRVLLTPEQIKAQFEKQGGRCYWLGVKLDPMDAWNVFDPLAPGIDRINNGMAYFPANIVITCRFANLGRQHAPCDDWWKKRIKQLRKAIMNEMWPKYLVDDQPPSLVVSETDQ